MNIQEVVVELRNETERLDRAGVGAGRGQAGGAEARGEKTAPGQARLRQAKRPGDSVL